MKDLFAARKYVIIAIIIIASVALLVKLFIIQVVQDTYRLSADNNVLRYVTQYPARGLIYDRNGKLIVFNQAAYDLMVVPAQTAKMDTALFCDDLDINKEVFRDRMKAARSYSSRAPSIFLIQISATSLCKIPGKIFMFPGFFVQPKVTKEVFEAVAHIYWVMSVKVDEATAKKILTTSPVTISVNWVLKKHTKQS
jgi:penicillin-binding protein 2